MCRNKLQFRRVWKHGKSHLHSESNGRKDDLNKVHNNWNCAHHRSRNFVKANVRNKLQFRKVWKHCKSYLNSESNGRNDDLNKVHNNWNGAHHLSRNFVKAKMCKTNSNFEKFQNAVNLIYTVYGVLEMWM